MGSPFKTLIIEDLIEINRRMIEEFGGVYFSEDQNLLFPGSLDHIFDSIQGMVFNVDQYPTIFEKAAGLAWRIIVGHVFHDGNKRTGMEACRLLMEINGYRMKIDMDAVNIALRIAKKEIQFSEFVDWIMERSEVF